MTARSDRGPGVMPKIRAISNVVVLYMVVIAITFCASILIVYFTSTVFKRMDDHLDQKQLEQLIGQRERAITEIENRLAMEIRNVRHHAEALGLVDNYRDIVKLFRRSVEGETKSLGALAGAAYVDNTGTLRAVYPETLNDSTYAPDIQNFYAFTSDKLGPTVGRTIEIKGIGQVIPMSYPVRRDLILNDEAAGSDELWGENNTLREVTGVLTIFFSLDELVSQTLINIDPFFLVDNKGNITPYGINTISREQIPLYQEQGEHPLDDTARNLLKGYSGVERMYIGGVDQLVFFAPIRFTSGFVNNRESLFTSDPHFFVGVGLLHREDILVKSNMARRNINLVVGSFTLALTIFLSLIAFITWLRLSEKNRTYEAQLKAAKEIAGSAAHHIFQPLTAINGYVKMMEIQAGSLPAEQSAKVGELVQKALAASDKIQAIVEDMNDLPGYRTEGYINEMQITVLDPQQENKAKVKK